MPDTKKNDYLERYKKWRVDNDEKHLLGWFVKAKPTQAQLDLLIAKNPSLKQRLYNAGCIIRSQS